MNVIIGRVVDGKIEVGSELEEGTAVAVLAAEAGAFHLTPDEELELESALVEIRAGSFVDGRQLLRDLKGQSTR